MMFKFKNLQSLSVFYSSIFY